MSAQHNMTGREICAVYGMKEDTAGSVFGFPSNRIEISESEYTYRTAAKQYPPNWKMVA